MTDRSEYLTNRKAYYARLLGDTTQSLQSLRAVSVKYTRDYLPFFEGLAKLYKTGPNRKRSTETVNSVKRTIALIDSVVGGGGLTSRDTQTLYELLQSVEDNRQYFIQQAKQNQALGARIEKVSEESGVGIEDLGVTPGIVRKAVRTDVQQARVQSLSGLGRQFSRTRALGGKVLGGVGAAVAGPFQPLLRAGLGVGRDALGVVGSLSKMLQERRRTQFASALRPVAAGADIPLLERIQSARGTGPDLAGFQGVRQRKVSVEEQTRPLQKFFDKGAYRAKWTKDLLETMQGVSREAKKDRGGGITDDLVKKIVAAATVAKGASVLGQEIGKTSAAVVGTSSARKEEHRLTESAIGSLSKRWATETDPARKDKLQQDMVRLIAQKREEGLGWSGAFDVLLGSQARVGQAEPKGSSRMKDFQETEVPDIVAKTLQLMRENQSQSSGMASQDKTAKESLAELNKLNSRMEELVAQFKEFQTQKNRYDSAPSPGVGDPFDSGDTLLRNHADGNLSTGE